MKDTAFLVPLMVATALFAVGAGDLAASEEVAAQEGVECLVCHADPEQEPRTLTDRGLYYQTLRSLEGYEALIERFENCTYCHVDRAGDQSLTADGYRFRWMMEDMVGLKAWLDQHHPQDRETPETE